MDDGICIVSSIMGGYDGTHHIRYVELRLQLRSFTDCGLVQHLLSGARLPFTAAYFGSIAFTLYFSIGVSDRPSGLPLLEMVCPGGHHLPSHNLGLAILDFLLIRALCHVENASLLTDWSA